MKHDPEKFSHVPEHIKKDEKDEPNTQGFRDLGFRASQPERREFHMNNFGHELHLNVEKVSPEQLTEGDVVWYTTKRGPNNLQGPLDVTIEDNKGSPVTVLTNPKIESVLQVQKYIDMGVQFWKEVAE